MSIREPQGLYLHRVKRFLEIVYIGDDINDLELLKRVGLSVTPSDASDDAIKLCDYICKHRSGNGAFRELADLILFTQNNKHKKSL